MIEKPCWGMCHDFDEPVVMRLSNDPKFPWSVEAKNGVKWRVRKNGNVFGYGHMYGRNITRILTGPEYPNHIPLDPAEWPPAPVEYCEWQGPGIYECENGRRRLVYHCHQDDFVWLDTDGSSWYAPGAKWDFVRLIKPLHEVVNN